MTYCLLLLLALVANSAFAVSACDESYGLFDVTLIETKDGHEQTFKQTMGAGCNFSTKRGINMSYPISIDDDGTVDYRPYFEGKEMVFHISVSAEDGPSVKFTLIESDIIVIKEILPGLKTPQINVTYKFKEFGLSKRFFGGFHFNIDGVKYILRVNKYD